MVVVVIIVWLVLSTGHLHFHDRRMSVIEISKQAFSGNHRAQASGKGKRTEDDYIQDERINKLIN
nr:BBF_HP1_G0000790.mRNA.1.CDS.1 [Saccharomyces cerevisiae]